MNQPVLNAFSVDVEDFFHGRAFRHVPREEWSSTTGRVEMNVHAILELFSEYGVKATFFFLGWIAQQYPALIREVLACGHEIASHGYWHDADLRSKQELYEDIRRAKITIEDILSAPVYGIRLPCFVNPASREWFLDAIESVPYAYDSSLYPAYHRWYAWNSETRRPHRVRPRLYEIPMSSLRVHRIEIPMGGGGYFRIFPAWTFIHGISMLNRQSVPAVMYIHPYDIDKESPAPRNMLKRLRRGIRAGGPLQKIGKLLEAYHFGRMIDLLPKTFRQTTG